MSRKRTIEIEDSVYDALQRVVGRGSVSKFIEDLARPHVAQKDLGAQYREAARDAAREDEARAWIGKVVLTPQRMDLDALRKQMRKLMKQHGVSAEELLRD